VVINKAINPRFESFLADWDYTTYLLLGGYGSSKSYHIALKIVLKCLEEKRKVLVIREVYETIRESCFDLFCEILEDMNLLAQGSSRGKNRQKVVFKTSPLQLHFPNGSKVIFKGMDKPAKLKSINGVSIVWIEECSEVKYNGYKELLGRIRNPYLTLHFILSTNPVGEENWVFKHFFIDNIEDRLTLDPERLYARKTVVKKGVYYHHSLPDDNYFLPKSYLRTLDEMAEYDPDLHRVARLGRFGANGIKVLPQISKMSHKEVMKSVSMIPEKYRFNGMDFGFETSYNAIVRLAVDDEEKILYVYWEYYKNKRTDDVTAVDIAPLKGIHIIADNEDPKAIRFYQLSGFKMTGCRKFAGSRLANTRKIKRFRKIYVSDNCPNTWRELKDLTYKKDSKGELVYDDFSTDPHTFSAMWYGLDNYEVANIKQIPRNSRKGA